MTREEAIEYFKRHIDLYCVEGICREAEEMAIKALEQEPCEDAISRKQAIKTIEKFCSPECVQVCVLTELPPVTPQPKTGQWIKTKERDDAEPLILWKCSECLTVQRLKTNYCPNCGAKMKEGD